MTEALDRYRRLEDDLVFVRWVNQGLESDKEDAILDEMDEVWWDLDDQERALIEATPPRSLIRGPSAGGYHRRLVDSDLETNPAAPPRKTEEAA